jgi:DNA-binding CsgD family transcriptional regulator
VLVGRAAECGVIDRLLQSARESEGGVLLLRGEAGVGKTSLVDRAAESAGFRTLRATGVEAESDLPYAAAHQLLHPLLPLLDELPQTQAHAVRVALGMAAGGTPDRFLVALGFLSLVSEAAREGPVLLVLDDIQWCDAASLDATLFVGRRIGAEPVVLLLAARDQAGGREDPAGSVFGLPGLTELRLEGLPLADVDALMTQIAGVAPSDPVSRTLTEHTHGNPLALVELARALSPDQIAGRQPLPSSLPLGERLERPFLARAARLSTPARDLLLVVAAEPGADLDLLAAAASVTDLEGLVDEVEASGLALYADGRLNFCHPLARSAVYGDTTTRQRHAAHLSISQELASRGDEDRSVWHRAAATMGVDDDIAKALDEVALRARDRSAFASAATASERAAELSGTAPARTERLISAGEAAWLAGQPARAKLLLDRAEHSATDPATRGRLCHLQARAASRRGDVHDAHRLFLAGASLLTQSHPAEAAEMLAEAVEAAGYSGDREPLVQIAELSRRLPQGSTPRQRFLAAWLAVNDAGLRGQVAEDAAELRQTLELGDQLGDPRLTVWAGIGALQLGDVPGMQRLFARALEQARGAGAVASLPYALEHAALSLLLAGRYAATRSLAEEGLRLARETDQQRSASQLLAILAIIASTTGDEDRCLGLAAQAQEIAGPRGLGLPVASVSWALARLDLGLGRFNQAVDRLLALARAKPGEGHPVVSLWTVVDLVEAATRARRVDEVRDAVERVEAVVRAGRQPGAAATLAWCRGMMGGPQAAEDLASAADDFHRFALPLAEARARLALGELLRRDRQPRAARVHLRAALEAFHALGARVWEDRAAAELRASGETVQAPESSGLETLTAQELQIVRYVSQGASNRDVAAQLFISPRTVEYHLYKAYPKLGISSRTQLISQFAATLAPDAVV